MATQATILEIADTGKDFHFYAYRVHGHILLTLWCRLKDSTNVDCVVHISGVYPFRKVAFPEVIASFLLVPIGFA